jgi:von Willebrand factor type A domain/RTX calcium-binding nonapeptide repeat (4 copies)
MATLNGTPNADHLNGGADDDILNGLAGDDFLNGGAKNDTLNGGADSDRVDGDSGNDKLVYVASENAAGAHDVYDGGSGIDTLRLELTLAEFQNLSVQQDIIDFLAFIADHTLPNGQADNKEFHFQSFDLNTSKIENLELVVDGVVIDPHTPFAVDDAPFFVESTDVATVDVLANDIDLDGDMDPTTLAFLGAAPGASALNVGGQLQYTAPNIGGDTIDDSFGDVLTYTVADTDGNVSNAASVTAKVIDPLVETASDTDTADNGQDLTLSLATEDRTFNTTSFVDVDLTAGALIQPNVNVSFVIDESGSIDPATFDIEVQAVQDTIDALRLQFDGTGATVTVQIVDFDTGATQQVFDLFNAALDDVATTTNLSSQGGGLTNYEAALDLASSFFSAHDGESNFLLFVSDGVPTAGGTFTDEVTELEGFGVSISAVGFGAGIDTATLDLIDNTGGSQVLTSADELADALAASPLFPADLLDFSLTVNGNLVATEANLIDNGGGSFSLDPLIVLSALDNTLGADNVVVATATFDNNNDGVVDPDDIVLVGTTHINGTDGSNVIFGPDL